jgi:hypothetical protein
MSTTTANYGENSNSIALSQTDTVIGIDNIIIVAVLVPKSDTYDSSKHGLMNKIRGLKNKGLASEPSLKNEKEGKLRVVYMPRREYLKYFVKDAQGNYAGIEPES